jgi:hypothetical protein
VSIKAELREFVEQLNEEQAAQALAVLQHYLDGDEATEEHTEDPLGQRMGPLNVSGSEFFSQQPKSLKELAAEQGVKPITSIDELRGDFWPDDESIDEFVKTIRRWRREGGYA